MNLNTGSLENLFGSNQILTGESMIMNGKEYKCAHCGSRDGLVEIKKTTWFEVENFTRSHRIGSTDVDEFLRKFREMLKTDSTKRFCVSVVEKEDDY